MRRKSGGGADRPGRPVGQHIEDVAYNEALSERYLAYALSTITARSLPDVRDGLKPVHRRLIYAMLQLKLSPTEGFKKCARVVGDVIGKYHPHGDISVYEAMVRLAQHFSVRYRLVDGQGNFGSIDGDNAAAMRYTEARLTAYALALAEDLDMDTVDFVPNYDGSEHEPAVMPSAVPNLLANGSEGIAVGMATSVPPHNIGELCAAMTELLRDPQGTDIAAIMRHVKGPDFPTGGLLVEPEENIRKAYETGRGSFRLRARWHTEDAGRGQIRIVVTEIPFQVQKSRLIERIADLMKLKKITVLADVRDESAEDIRMVLEPKNRQIPPEAVMETLFKTTELETRFPLNMNVLDKDNVPRVMSLKEVMQCFLDHRRETLLRKTRWRTARIDERLEILEGLLVAYLNLDEVIRIIREEDEPKAIMMARWNLTDRQTEAILNMRLRSLRKLEEIAITAERNALELERAGLAEILNSEARQTEVLLAGLEDIRRRFGEDNKEEGPRRSILASAPENVPDLGAEAFVEKEPVIVFCSKQGWIRMFKGRDVDPAQVKYKDGDGERYAVPCFTTDKLLAFTCEGKCYTLQVHLLAGGKSAGEPLHVLFDMPEGTDVIALLPLKAGEKLLLASADGRGFRLNAEDAEAQTKLGKRLMNLDEKEQMRWCLPVTGDRVAALGENRKFLIFDVEEIPEMKRGRGAMLQKYKQGGMADLRLFNAMEGISWTSNGKKRTLSAKEFAPWLGARGSAGKTAPMGYPKTDPVLFK